MNEADRIDEAAIARAARSAFERSVAELDAEARGRLVRARHEALGRLADPRGASLMRGPAPTRGPALVRALGRGLEALVLQPRGWAAAAVAVVLALSVAWLMPRGTPLLPDGRVFLSDGAAPTPGRGVQLASSPDVDLLLDGDELDLLEDLDFYSWLGQQGDPPAADEDGIG